MNPRVSRGIMDIDDTSMAQVSLLDAPYVTFIRRDKGASSLFFFLSCSFSFPLTGDSTYIFHFSSSLLFV